MQALLSLSRAIDRVNAIVGRWAIWLIMAATAISALNAVVRKLFNYSSNAYLEVQWYLFAWSFLIAAGYTLLHGEHVRIDVLNHRLPKKARVWIDILGYGLFLTPLCLVMLYLGTPLLIERFVSGEMSPNPGGLVRWPVWVAVPLGFALLLLQGWSELIKCIAFLRGQGPDPTESRKRKTDEEELAEALRREQAAAGGRAPTPLAP
ncbi:MAG: C4-dicarboxylate ABC transporter substrate-binding protein [Rubrivivax sp. SCN 71-131]|jgi:TRAP-type mannitol/chloroaromatic compound transport system permease small subunit|nr:MAG: C4-dicarboxylate ABC transporter substrate-binding protein [Rubrivivax sp. SCN 71-131]